ncbi:MAG: hypothetical protein PVF40_09415 [Ectothiorhodospiraceae bacterium]|jgi:hypothetical protein
MLYFWFSVILLAALLLVPTTRLIWVLSVRRLQRKLGRELTDEETAQQRTRARFIAIILSAAFSLLFNINLLGFPGHG